MTYTYDSCMNGSGRLATLTYPDGNQASYHYQYGRLSGITATVNGSTKTVASSLTYRGGDRLLTSWTAGNGLVNSYTYDGDGRLTGIQVPGIQSLGFTYDAAANLITDITNGIHPSLTQTFTYDAMSRLIQIASSAGNQSFVYDANGNRTSHTVNGVKTPSVIQPDSNRLASVGGQAIGYDANGNTTTVGGVVKYHYDSFNRLESAGGATFYINPEGQRLRKSGPAGTTYFAPDRSGQLLADEPGGVWKDYVWMGGRMVGMIAQSTVYTLHSDQTGRVLTITNPSGAVAWEAEGLAFHRRTTSGNPAFFRLGFPGQYWDVEDNLWHNGFRDYDPALGRYIESDPIGLSGGINTYAYAGGYPLGRIDPLGMSWWDSIVLSLEWATGTGPEHQDFGPSSSEADEMRNAPGVLAAEAYYRSKNAQRIKAGCDSGSFQAVTNYASHFGLKGLFGSGFNPSEQFVGSYRVDIYPAADNKMEVVINNTSSFRSFAYGVAPAWNRSSFGPMGNMSQTIWFLTDVKP